MEKAKSRFKFKSELEPISSFLGEEKEKGRKFRENIAIAEEMNSMTVYIQIWVYVNIISYHIILCYVIVVYDGVLDFFLSFSPFISLIFFDILLSSLGYIRAYISI